MYKEFHEWLKKKDYDPNYPDAWKVFDFAQEFPELLSFPNNNPRDTRTFDRCLWIFARYDERREYFLKLDFWQLCRSWRKEYGKQWKQMFQQGFDRGKYFSGAWYPVLMSLKDAENNPEEYGYALGRNRVVLERR